ncbi:NAD(P)/FAD-dependent oxidoreductase [Aquabacterium sp. A7-Y]|uniref:flavin-containing monooxygenase n=1 Tax=Aquabacterium sp. A7-Y TaxID=1349605 RepID=UPI00223E8DB2|nr:NAD(P)/FAD-dependent oxidoreductase [Aquabacterium sp. A7-Y]MCW7537916.1 NAD(P)/FAD-dependent oxidoreductase [Aquabacterium sp. A7-Y]
MAHTTSSEENVAVVIVGSGFAGLCMSIRLKQAGIHDFVMLERGEEVGGTWRDNHYPGAACDVPSVLYSLSFEPNPHWSRHYPTQPELLDYQRHCARKYGLLPHLRFQADVVQCRYDAAAACWRVTTRDGRRFVAPVLVSGMGGLSNPALPDIAGLARFEGQTFHSAAWNHNCRLEGKRVAVIGSGASAIQFLPRIAPQAAQLDYYQRTPPWVIPKPDRALRPWEQALFRRLPLAQKLRRWWTYCLLEWRVLAFTSVPALMKTVEWQSQREMHRHIGDPELRRKLTPRYRAGCKRILLASDYYPTLARPNVEVVTDGIREIGPHGIVTDDGRERPADVIVLATGFKIQEMAPAGLYLNARGEDLADAWRGGPEAYLGTTVPGYPNLFLIVGPNTGLGHNSMIYMIESQVRYILDALLTMRREGLREVEVRPEVVRRYNDRLQAMLQGTVWTSGGCRSWYLNAQGRNTTLWPGFTFSFRRQLRRFDPSRYLIRHTG